MLAQAMARDLLSTDQLLPRHRQWLITIIGKGMQNNAATKQHIRDMAAAYSAKGWRQPAFEAEDRKWRAVLAAPMPPTHAPVRIVEPSRLGHIVSPIGGVDSVATSQCGAVPAHAMLARSASAASPDSANQLRSKPVLSRATSDGDCSVM